MRFDAIERVRLPRHLDVVRDVRPFLHELVRLDDEAVHVPAEDADADIAHRSRPDRCEQPADSGRRDRIDERHRRAQHERERDDERPRQRDVRIRVGDAREDRVILQQPIEPPEVHADGEHQERERERD